MVKELLILIEGIDRVGKSTLAKKLNEKIEGSILLDRSFDDAILGSEEYNQSNTNAREFELINFYESLMRANKDAVLIVDRFHLSTCLFETIDRKNFDSIGTMIEIDSYLSGRDDIYLIEVFPEDIELSSTLHGSDLKDYDKYMMMLFGITTISNVIATSWNGINNRFDEIVKMLFSKDEYDFYIAGPFFNEKQIDVIKGIENAIENAGMTYFSPRLTGVVDSESSDATMEEIFAHDLEAIDRARCIIAVTDGKDMGTLFECGYAFATCVPIIYVALELNGKFNLMLAKSARQVLTSFDEINESLAEIKKLGFAGIPKKDYGGEIE